MTVTSSPSRNASVPFSPGRQIRRAQIGVPSLNANTRQKRPFGVELYKIRATEFNEVGEGVELIACRRKGSVAIRGVQKGSGSDQQYREFRRLTQRVEFSMTSSPGNSPKAPHRSAPSEIYNLHPSWGAFIRFCSDLKHGEIERLSIQDGLPVLATTTRKKVKFTT
jgi:hypothetical protein